jgi:hypothetical protein
MLIDGIAGGNSHGVTTVCSIMARMFGHDFESRIRDLCAKIIAAPEADLEPVLSELQTALHEHTVHLRRMAARNLVKKTDEK